jgi:GntR family transcriptional regulator
MIVYKFPKELQEKFESDIVSGKLKKGLIVKLDDLQKQYQTDLENLKIVVTGSIRKGLLRHSAISNSFTILGKSKPTIISVFQHAAKTGLAPESIVRDVIVKPASELVAQKLNINIGEPVFQQSRTRLVNNEVIANQNNYIPIEVCPGLESVDLSHTSFQTVLEGQFNAVVAEIKESFKIFPASLEDTEILGVEKGTDILIVERLSMSLNGLPLVWADIHVRPDRYHYVKDLWPEAENVLKQING